MEKGKEYYEVPQSEELIIRLESNILSDPDVDLPPAHGEEE